jgi:predicted transposase/invertase (TIGR01784 family)
MNNGFISPLDDDVVKGVFGDQKNIGNTEGLLKPALGIPPEEYGKLTIVDPFLKRLWKKDKQGILDIRLTTTTGRIVNVEVQVEPQKAMLQRIIYYHAKMITEQMKSGFEYDKIRQTISVVITNYVLLPGETQYMNTYELRNSESGGLFTDLQKFVILELPKVPETDDGQEIWPQLRFFKCRTKEDFQMLLKRHPEVQPVVAEYQRISWSEKRRKIADYKEKIRRDEWARTEYVRDEGREQGRAEGVQKTAKNFLDMGLSPEQVAKGTGLDLAAVTKLAEK